MKVEIDGVRYIPAPKVLSEGLDAALDVEIEESDAGDNITVRQYLQELLLTLWNEQEGFSGKRPWGNSGWSSEIISPLIKAGFIPGKADDPDDPENKWYNADDWNQAHAFVADLILRVFSK